MSTCVSGGQPLVVTGVDSSEHGWFWSTSVAATGPLYSSGPLHSSRNSITSNTKRLTVSKKQEAKYKYNGVLPRKVFTDLVRPGKPLKSFKVLKPLVLNAAFLEDVKKMTTNDLLTTIQNGNQECIYNMYDLQYEITEMTRMMVNVDFDIDRSNLHNIRITVANQKYQEYIKFSRQDFLAQHAVVGKAPLNWIATIPLDCDRFKFVHVTVNKKMERFDTDKRVYEFTPKDHKNILLCLIFKHIPQSSLYNWCITSNILEEYQSNEKDQCLYFSLFINSLTLYQNKVYKNFDKYMVILEVLDKYLLEYQIYKMEIQQILCLHDKSLLIQDMTINPKDISESLQIQFRVGAQITREDVINSIILDEGVCYANNDFMEKFESIFDYIPPTLKDIHDTLIYTTTAYVSWEQWHDALQSTPTHRDFDSKCHDLLQLRISLMRMFAFQIATSRDIDNEIENEIDNETYKLFQNTFICIDNSIIFNIDSMCDTKDILHGVCIAQYKCKKSTAVKYAIFCLEKSKCAMDLRLAGPLNKHQTLVSRINNPLVNLILKNSFIQSMEQYIAKETVRMKISIPVDYNTIARTYDVDYKKPKPYQYTFCEDTMQLYSREPIKVLLDAILHVLANSKSVTTKKVEYLTTILNTEHTNKQNNYDKTVALTVTFGIHRHFILKICHNIIFEHCDPGLLTDTQNYLISMIQNSDTHSLL